MDFKSMWEAMGFKGWAADAKPEDIAKALSAYGKDEDRDDKKDDKKEANDAKVSDARTRLHGALDRMLDSKDDEQKAMDADMDELKKMFGGKADDSAAADEESDEEKEETEATDESKFVGDEEAEEIAPEDRPKPDVPAAVDAAYRKGQRAALDALKPIVAKSGDKKLMAAFDTASKVLKGTQAKQAGSYGKVAEAAAKRSSAVGNDSAAKLQNDAAAAYASRFRK